MRRLRQALRRGLPDGVVAPLRRTERYLNRLRDWGGIARDVRGVTPADRRALRRSLLAAPATSARSLDCWADPLLLDDATVDVRGVGRFHARARCDDLWHVAPRREGAVVRAIRARLKAGHTFVDAGANIGFYTVLAARIVGPAGRVVAFEMMPDTAAALRRHVELNGLTNVTVIEQALFDRSGETVEAYPVEGKFGQASISRDGRGRPVRVKTTTLDEALADVAPIAVMKMDIEGAEAKALGGAAETLRRTDHVIFESLGEDAEIDDALTAAGFAVRAIDGRNRLASRG